MNKLTRLAIASILSAIALAAAPISEAQQPSNPPAAPIPTQILTGKKVFIANGEGDAEDLLDVPTLTYNAFYAYIKNVDKYELVSAPTDADLVFQIRFLTVPLPKLHLVILDPKTNVVLWSFVEPVQVWTRVATGRKNFDSAMAYLVERLKMLTQPPPPTAAPIK